MVADALEEVTVPSNQIIVPKGSATRKFQIVLSGSVVVGDSVKLTRGGHFGEGPILRNKAAKQTIKTGDSAGATLLVMAPERFIAFVPLNCLLHETAQQEQAVQSAGLMTTRRMGKSSEPVGGGGGRRLAPPGLRARAPGPPPTNAEKQAFLSSCRKVLAFTRLDDNQLMHLRELMAEHVLQPGDVAVTEGEKGESPRPSPFLATLCSHRGGRRHALLFCRLRHPPRAIDDG